MNIIDDKLSTIINRKKFTTFIECFDYLSIAGYPESDAIAMSLYFFKGNIYDGIISINKKNKKEIRGDFSGATQQYSGATYYDVYCEVDDLVLEVFILSNEGNVLYNQLYKAYIETRTYEKNENLEKQIKLVEIRLTTELGIKFFLNIMEKITN